MQKRIFMLVGILSLTLWNACSTLSVDKARLQTIKKVAVVGFTVEQEMPPDFDWSIVKMGKGQKGFDMNVSIASPAEHSTHLYELLQEKLKSQLKWNIIGRDTLSRTPRYVALYDQKMKGFQNRIVRSKDIKMFSAEGIIEAFPFQTMSADDRMALARELGVDAVVVATLQVKLERGGGLKQLVGAGEYIPQATLRFAVYDKTKPEPVWADWNAAGAKLDSGAEHVMGITRQDDVNKKVIIAVQYAYDRLIEHYKNSKG